MTMDANTSTLHLEEKAWLSSVRVSFDDQNIIAANVDIINESEYNPTKMTMSYNKGKNMNIWFEAPGVIWSFDWVLQSNWDFKSFDMMIDAWEDFDMSMTLFDKNLVWSMQASMWGQELMTADIVGTLEQDYLKTKIIFEVADFMQGSEDTYKGNINLMVDTRNNKNNLDFWFNIGKQDKNIVEFEMISESTIKYWEVEILAPENFVEAEDVWNPEDFEELY